MLGHTCLQRFRTEPGWEVAGTQRSDPDGAFYLDVSATSDDLERAITARRWDFIVNALGVLRSLIDHRDVGSVCRAIRINAIVPHEVSAIAGRYGSRLIHISSDAVFGGSSDEPLTESSPASPIDFYGATKLLGESAADNAINLRCSIIGRDPWHHRGLMEWIQTLAPGSTVPGYMDYVWSAATTLQVADLCVALTGNGVFDRLRRRSGVYHFAPNPPVSKFDLARMTAEVARRDVTIVPAAAPTGAVRRILATAIADFQALYPEPRPWQDLLADALAVPADPVVSDHEDILHS